MCLRLAETAGAGLHCGDLGHAGRDGSAVDESVVGCDQLASSVSPVSRGATRRQEPQGSLDKFPSVATETIPKILEPSDVRRRLEAPDGVSLVVVRFEHRE